jgi:hypothetical protein
MHQEVNPLMSAGVTLRTKTEVARFFNGLDLLEPGLVIAPGWRPASDFEARAPAALWGGVARKP